MALRALGGAVESKMPATPSESEAETELVYKIMVVGNAACGKTSIINRFVNNVFSETCAPRMSPVARGRGRTHIDHQPVFWPAPQV